MTKKYILCILSAVFTDVLLNSGTTGGERYKVNYTLAKAGNHTKGVNVVIDHTSSGRNATVGYYAKW